MPRKKPSNGNGVAAPALDNKAQLRDAIRELEERLAFEETKDKCRAELRSFLAKRPLTRKDVMRIARELPTFVPLDEMKAAPKGMKAWNGSRTLPPKYRNPDDPALTWAGKGHQPRWLKDWLRHHKGKKIDELLIVRDV